MSFSAADETVLTRADLLAAGLRPKRITRAVKEGVLIRVRRDRYMFARAQNGIDRAVRVGGRLACVSFLAVHGAFVLDASRLHIHLEHGMSRLRAPDAGKGPLDEKSRGMLALHWWPLRGEGASLGTVGLSDAVAQAVRCQSPRAAVATVDSVLHLRLMGLDEVEDVFATLPRRYRAILDLADGSAESGPETFMRLILRQLGLRFRTQVEIAGVGRVDFLVEGWLIVECDSKQFHEGWEKQRQDRKRDLAAGALGYATLRPLAEDLLYDQETVVAAVRGMARRFGRSS